VERVEGWKPSVRFLENRSQRVLQSPWSSSNSAFAGKGIERIIRSARVELPPFHPSAPKTANSKRGVATTKRQERP
jgi:hypothetical protein